MYSLKKVDEIAQGDVVMTSSGRRKVTKVERGRFSVMLHYVDVGDGAFEVHLLGQEVMVVG